jgi:hypothetical protein
MRRLREFLTAKDAKEAQRSAEEFTTEVAENTEKLSLIRYTARR